MGCAYQEELPTVIYNAFGIEMAARTYFDKPYVLWIIHLCLQAGAILRQSPEREILAGREQLRSSAFGLAEGFELA